MSDKRIHTDQIDKYLKGELDGPAMHQLERAAQDDPFLADALEGFAQSSKDHQANLGDLSKRLAERVKPRKERSILLWRVLPIAAGLLLMIGIGYWAFVPKPEMTRYASAIKPERVQIKPNPKQDSSVEDITVPPISDQKQAPSSLKTENSRSALIAKSESRAAATDKSVIYKADTVEYKAAAYKVRKNETVDELLKKVPGISIDSAGSLIAQGGQRITKARINGKDFMGGDMQTAIKNLPADIVNKIQIIDDYGDQAAKTGIKDGDPAKILNLTTDSLRKVLVATNKPVNQLKEVSILSQYGIYKKQNTADNIPMLIKSDSMLRVGKATNNAGYLSTNEVTGYGTQKKLDVTGSMFMSGKTQGDSVTSGLSGRVAGVAIAEGKVVSSRTITGKVVDKNDGAPLPGVRITINRKPGVITNANGEFKITFPPGTDETLTVNYVGYENKQVTIKNQQGLKIELVPNTAALSEVVVVGYGSTKSGELADEPPQPSAGWRAYDKYLNQSTLLTPGKSVTIKLSFIVTSNGLLTNIKVIKGSTEELNRRAIKIIENGPQWKPAGDGKAHEVTLKLKFHQ